MNTGGDNQGNGTPEPAAATTSVHAAPEQALAQKVVRVDLGGGKTLEVPFGSREHVELFAQLPGPAQNSYIETFTLEETELFEQAILHHTGQLQENAPGGDQVELDPEDKIAVAVDVSSLPVFKMRRGLINLVVMMTALVVFVIGIGSHLPLPAIIVSFVVALFIGAGFVYAGRRVFRGEMRLEW